MAAPENIKAGFIKEKDVFAENGIRYVSPLVCLAEPLLVPNSCIESLRDVLDGLTVEETKEAVDEGYRDACSLQRADARSKPPGP